MRRFSRIPAIEIQPGQYCLFRVGRRLFGMRVQSVMKALETVEVCGLSEGGIRTFTLSKKALVQLVPDEPKHPFSQAPLPQPKKHRGLSID